MGQMNPLFNFSHAFPHLPPYVALDQYVATHINGSATIQTAATPGPAAGGGSPMAAPPLNSNTTRATSFSAFPVASPAVDHLQLPGSPLMAGPSPGMGAMTTHNPGLGGPTSATPVGAPPNMVAAPVANTSPATSKRPHSAVTPDPSKAKPKKRARG